MTHLEIPILAYHASNVTGNTYIQNDHIAFESDLYTLHQLGYKIVPLKWIGQWVNGERNLAEYGSKLVGLSCDDGLDLDFKDGNYFDFGPQKSLFNILTEFITQVGQENQPHANLTSFVIASPEGRKKIDDKSLNSHNLLNEDWWQDANESGLMDIENHSWDHRHPDIYKDIEANFTSVTEHKTAQLQIIQAKNYIDKQLGEAKTSLFAYPWGHTNDYLTEHFLPIDGTNNGIEAAFTCGAEKVTQNTNRWKIPRYICGFNWKSPADLTNLLIL